MNKCPDCGDELVEVYVTTENDNHASIYWCLGCFTVFERKDEDDG